MKISEDSKIVRVVEIYEEALNQTLIDFGIENRRVLLSWMDQLRQNHVVQMFSTAMIETIVQDLTGNPDLRLAVLSMSDRVMFYMDCEYGDYEERYIQAVEQVVKRRMQYKMEESPLNGVTAVFAMEEHDIRKVCQVFPWYLHLYELFASGAYNNIRLNIPLD